jgi:hypothetical protein
MATTPSNLILIKAKQNAHGDCKYYILHSDPRSKSRALTNARPVTWIDESLVIQHARRWARQYQWRRWQLAKPVSYRYKPVSKLKKGRFEGA